MKTKKKIKDLHKIERPREKLEKYGVGKLSSTELLAIILGTGTKENNVIELSKKILQNFSRKNEGIICAQLEELQTISGLGAAKSCQIVACFELGKRFLKNKKSALLLSPKEVWQEMKEEREKKKEHFVIFFLDTRNQVIKKEVVSVGTLSSSLVHPREVFEPAVRNLAAQIIIAHNHPSGNLSPSDEDLAITERLKKAGEILGIELLDHVIVSSEKWLSMKEEGLI